MSERTAVGVEERIRRRLEALATAAGIPAPPLVVVPPSEHREDPVLAEVRGRLGRARIEVTVPLVVAGPDVQDRHLATCLGWWTSGVPRRRRRWALAVVATLALAHAVGVPDRLDLPGWLEHGSAVLMTLVSALAGTWAHAWPRRAMDAAGRDILRSVGSAPAVPAPPLH